MSLAARRRGVVGWPRVTASLPRPFGRYTLLKSLRRGAMGEAFLAASGAGDEAGLCVVKLGLPELPPEAAARFADEAKVMRRLSFSAIARVFDSGTADGVRYLAMEYVEGWNLEELTTFARAAGQPMPPAVAAFIVKEIARALHYAHSLPDLSLIHRDVAPANVMIGVTGEVKLIDFGLARSTVRRGLTVPGAILGHVAYFAPERIAGEYDHRSDLYSAGVILWELLAGEALFGWRDGEGGAEAPPTRAAPPAPSARRPELGPDLDAIVGKALAPEPLARYQSGDELRSQLAAYLGRTAPETDSMAVAAFLREAIGEAVIEAQRCDRERLLASTRMTPPSGPVPQVAHVGPGTAGPHLGHSLEGKYELTRLCGTGGMGDVYEARHVGIGRKVAVKVLKPEYRERQDVVERFTREARLASRADSEQIVQVTDTGVTPDGCPYLVMEYLEGETLRRVLDRERLLPLDRALPIVLEVARGLERAHAAGVVHRDMKPSNVMLVPGADGGPTRVKLLDFGISKNLVATEGGERPLTRALTPLGTPEYMAPEQAMGLPADYRADVYAVGCMLFEMLTGRTPFEGETAEAIMHRKQGREAPRVRELLPELPAVVDDVVARALARVREARHESMAAFRADLERLTSQIRPAALPPPAPPARPHRARLALALGAGVAALTVVAAFWLGRTSDEDTPASAPARELPTSSAPPAPAAQVAVPPPTAAAAPSAGAPLRQPEPSPLVEPSTPASRPRAAARPHVKPAPTAEAPNARALAKAASAALARKSYVDAIELGDDALAAGANDADLHITLGTANLMLGRSRQAEAHFRKAADLDPGNEKAAEGLAAIRGR
jgi:serine/threonine-protein kinase